MRPGTHLAPPSAVLPEGSDFCPYGHRRSGGETHGDVQFAERQVGGAQQLDQRLAAHSEIQLGQLVEQGGAGGQRRARCGNFGLQDEIRVEAVRYGLVQLGAAVGGVPLPRKPKVVDADACSEPLYEALLIDTDEPVVVRFPFHTWVMAGAPDVQPTVQPLIALPPAVTVTSPS